MTAGVLLACATLLALASSAAAACRAGDIPCFCRSIGGTYRYGKSPIIDTCRVYYQHQGRQRWAHVFLPKSYDGRKRFPMWMHLHGVFWASMGGIGQQVGGPVDGTDIIPVWDRTISQFGNQAIFVYPQSTGYAGSGDPKEEGKYKQFWNIPFWRCSVGVCADSSVDDVGFIDKVIQDMPRRLNTVKKGQIYLSGDSAGGMMVYVMLCQSQVVSRMVTAAADILGGVGREYAQSRACQNSKAVPFLKIQGVKDPFITYDRDILVDGVDFISSISAAKHRAARNGCTQTSHAGRWSSEAGGQVQCINYCGNKPGAKAARLCGITTAAHDTDHPWPGYVYQEAWRFFNSQAAKGAAGAARGQWSGGGGSGGRQQVVRRPAPYSP